MATAAKPASAMKAMNRSVVVKRDQVCMEWFRTVNIIVPFSRKGKFGKPI
jgi:hypothetical protein